MCIDKRQNERSSGAHISSPLGIVVHWDEWEHVWCRPAANIDNSSQRYDPNQIVIYGLRHVFYSVLAIHNEQTTKTDRQQREQRYGLMSQVTH